MASAMFNKYVWLVNTIYEAGRISKEEQTPRVYALNRIKGVCLLPDKTWKMPKNFHASVFTYFIAPTLDFVQELRSQGESIEVLSPADLRKNMQQSLEKGLKQYKK